MTDCESGRQSHGLLRELEGLHNTYRETVARVMRRLC